MDILDANDNVPQFSGNPITATIPENSPEGTFIRELIATDADSGTNEELFFSFVGVSSDNIFQIDNSTGIVTVRRSGPLDFEGATSTFFVQAMVQDMGTPPHSSQTLVCLLKGVEIVLNCRFKFFSSPFCKYFFE